MALEINSFIKDILAAPCFGFVGTLNDVGQPVMTRFFGFKSDDPLTSLTLYTFQKDAQRVLKHLTDSARISVTLSNAMDFSTAQFKGTYEKHYDPSNEEMTIVKENNAKQAKIMEMFGIQNGVFGNWNYEPSVAIVMSVAEIFDQTPKINSGNKIA